MADAPKTDAPAKVDLTAGGILTPAKRAEILAAMPDFDKEDATEETEDADAEEAVEAKEDAEAEPVVEAKATEKKPEPEPDEVPARVLGTINRAKKRALEEVEEERSAVAEERKALEPLMAQAQAWEKVAKRAAHDPAAFLKAAGVKLTRDLVTSLLWDAEDLDDKLKADPRYLAHKARSAGNGRQSELEQKVAELTEKLSTKEQAEEAQKTEAAARRVLHGALGTETPLAAKALKGPRAAKHERDLWTLGRELSAAGEFDGLDEKGMAAALLKAFETQLNEDREVFAVTPEVKTPAAAELKPAKTKTLKNSHASSTPGHADGALSFEERKRKALKEMPDFPDE